MKKTLAALMLIATTAARAEYLPPGCYVAFSNTSRCWQAADGVTQWTQYTNRTTGEQMYGTAIESIIYDGYEGDTALLQCGEDYNTAKSNSETHYAWYSECFESRKALDKSTSALIKKLRKACGSKCKRIK